MARWLDTPLTYLKGVGPDRAALLQTELNVHTFGDLLGHYPLRHEDRSTLTPIGELEDAAEADVAVQVQGTLVRLDTVSMGPRNQRLHGWLRDASGEVELVWFAGASWIQKQLKAGQQYRAFGKLKRYKNSLTLPHPELLPVEADGSAQVPKLAPIYPSTEKLKRRGLDGRGLAKLTALLVEQLPGQVPEFLPASILGDLSLPNRETALRAIHFPDDPKELAAAKARLKAEEILMVQLRQRLLYGSRKKDAGHAFTQIPSLKEFYEKHLPFELTEAQKRVIKEIRSDVATGLQMNRLLQGDVGSGKTIVAFLTLLMAADNGAQACLVAPTEILAQQHLAGLRPYAEAMGLRMALLTGSTKTPERKAIKAALETGELHFLVGTHAVMEKGVNFLNLGLCIIDEQHRFGVAQRARLWAKNPTRPPHVLVMTATPIPRTLAMTLYGDLDISSIDELPAGRKPITTVHRLERGRLRVFGFLREEIKKGRQVYIVYPLIEENPELELTPLVEGHLSVEKAFPPNEGFRVGILHGRMKPEDKEFEMRRFVKGETQILVATTVIEVGVNVPNASVMLIENAERFGLAQLHQLRGRVGRGAEQSYCILLTKEKLSREARTRIETMVQTGDGFRIAEVDLQLRGPGDLLGTQQSGVLDLKLTDLSADQSLIARIRELTILMLDQDPKLALPEHQGLRLELDRTLKNRPEWAKIS